MLRDRFDLVTASFVAQEQAISPGAQQPYGGDYQRTTRYEVVSVRVDNYTNRWLYLDTEGFVIPPFTHAFVINLFTHQASVRFRSVKSPFAPDGIVNFDGNPKRVTQPFPIGVLVSLYDDIQPQLAPQSLVRIDNALVEPTAGDSTLSSLAKPVRLGSPDNQSAWPRNGSLALPVVASPLFYESAGSGDIHVGGRNPNALASGLVAVLANVYTQLNAADEPQSFWGEYVDNRIQGLILSTDTAGLVDFEDTANVIGSRGNVTAYMGAMEPLPIAYGGAGVLVQNLRVRHEAAANIAYSIVYGVT